MKDMLLYSGVFKFVFVMFSLMIYFCFCAHENSKEPIPALHVEVSNALKQYISRDEIVITTENREEVTGLIRTYPQQFKDYEKSVVLENLSSSIEPRALLNLLLSFSQIKKLVLTINWQKEEHEEVIRETVERAIESYQGLEMLSLTDFRLANGQLLSILSSLKGGLKALHVRQNLFTPGIIEEVKKKLPNLDVFDIEADAYPALEQAVSWQKPSALYQLYYEAFLGRKGKYGELLGAGRTETTLTASYCLLVNYFRHPDADNIAPKTLAERINKEELLQKAILGDPEAQNNFGFLLIATATPQTDLETKKEAYRWFRKAHAQGFVEACMSLSFLAELNKDNATAIAYCSKAIDRQNHAGAFSRLGMLYAKYVNSLPPQKLLEALLTYLECAALLGHVQAQYECAESIKSLPSQNQTNEHKKKIIKFYKLAAEQGHAQAKEALTRLERASS